jgi:membrane glycosyltransferase
MLNALVKTTYAPCFHLYILSDTDDPSIARAEAKLTDQMQQRFGSFIKITYRQRQHHHGFKAGNLRDFCERWGTEHDYLIVLDADSVMSAASLLRLVRIMQANAQLGIVQTLVTALPTSSAFARIFQFGMRLGMRSYTFGGASWQGDCGPYWGHNAIIRLAPFVSQCELPLLAGHPPLGGHLLSHDQVEAVLMRRAGYEVRVLPLEDGSYEENPPTLLEFIRRDLRWCQGNMQYFKLLSLPNLYPVSRLQLVLAILMYVSAPAWLGFMFFGLIRHQPFHAELGAIMLMISLFMSFAPKCATLAAIMLDAKQRHAFGGRLYLIIGAIVEFFFSLLIVPIAAVSVSLFTLGLPFGRKVGWTTQLRDSEGLPWRTACQALWFHTLIGCGFVFWLAIAAPAALWIGAPFYSGLILSIPFAIFTAHPRIGEIAARYKLCAIPEELFAPDPTADALFNPLRTKPSPTPQ